MTSLRRLYNNLWTKMKSGKATVREVKVLKYIAYKFYYADLKQEKLNGKVK